MLQSISQKWTKRLCGLSSGPGDTAIGKNLPGSVRRYVETGTDSLVSCSLLDVIDVGVDVLRIGGEVCDRALESISEDIDDDSGDGESFVCKYWSHRARKMTPKRNEDGRKYDMISKAIQTITIVMRRLKKDEKNYSFSHQCPLLSCPVRTPDIISTPLTLIHNKYHIQKLNNLAIISHISKVEHLQPLISILLTLMLFQKKLLKISPSPHHYFFQKAFSEIIISHP